MNPKKEVPSITRQEMEHLMQLEGMKFMKAFSAIFNRFNIVKDSYWVDNDEVKKICNPDAKKIKLDDVLSGLSPIDFIHVYEWHVKRMLLNEFCSTNSKRRRSEITAQRPSA